MFVLNFYFLSGTKAMEETKAQCHVTSTIIYAKILFGRPPIFWEIGEQILSYTLTAYLEHCKCLIHLMTPYEKDQLTNCFQ